MVSLNFPGSVVMPKNTPLGEKCCLGRVGIYLGMWDGSRHIDSHLLHTLSLLQSGGI